MNRLFREWNEVWLFPIVVLLFFIVPYFLIRLDPEAGTYDSGVLQVLFLTTLSLYFGKIIVWLALRIGAPGVYNTLNRFLLTNADKITIWQKGIFSLLYFSVLLFSWVLLLKAFM